MLQLMKRRLPLVVDLPPACCPAYEPDARGNSVQVTNHWCRFYDDECGSCALFGVEPRSDRTACGLRQVTITGVEAETTQAP